jgi:hypothetical protein
MPAILRREQQTIYLAVWDHKHGVDNSAHTTERGAFKQCIEWARNVLKEWQDESFNELTDEELFDNWGDITGFTEFFSVKRLHLHKDVPDEREA